MKRLRVIKGYESLAEVLDRALEQAQSGKGKERHANGKPFDQQPIRTIGDDYPGFLLGQATKKTLESRAMTPDRAERELLGAIVFTAAEIMRRRREIQKPKKKTKKRN